MKALDVKKEEIERMKQERAKKMEEIERMKQERAKKMEEACQNMKEFEARLIKSPVIKTTKDEDITEEENHSDYLTYCGTVAFQEKIKRMEEDIKTKEGEERLVAFVEGIGKILRGFVEEWEKKDKAIGADEMMPFLTVAVTKLSPVGVGALLDLMPLVEKENFLKNAMEDKELALKYLATHLVGAMTYIQKGSWREASDA